MMSDFQEPDYVSRHSVSSGQIRGQPSLEWDFRTCMPDQPPGCYRLSAQRKSKKFKDCPTKGEFPPTLGHIQYLDWRSSCGL